MRSLQEQYDDIGKRYEAVKRLPAARYPERTSFLEAWGNMAGRTVVDLGCGTGHYTRLLRDLGAASIIGVDASPAMVEAAQQPDPGVRYEVADAASWRQPDEAVDLVSAAFLLNSAADTAELQALCDAAASHLRPNGRLVALVQNPDYDPDGPPMTKYGFDFVPLTETAIGWRARVHAHIEPDVRFETTFVRRGVYEYCLYAAGFHDITWEPITIGAEGLAAHGADYWVDYLDNPPIHVLSVRAGDQVAPAAPAEPRRPTR